MAILQEDDVDDPRAELEMLHYWLQVDRFDRRVLNRQLRQCAAAEATIPIERTEVWV